MCQDDGCNVDDGYVPLFNLLDYTGNEFHASSRAYCDGYYDLVGHLRGEEGKVLSPWYWWCSRCQGPHSHIELYMALVADREYNR